MDALSSSDACFKGPTTTIPIPNAPRSVAVTLRQKFELYSNIRPCKTFERLTPNRSSLDLFCTKQASDEDSASIVESGMYVGSFLPFFSHCSEPASATRISWEKPHSESIPSIESTISGPIPSPFITTAVFPNMQQFLHAAILTIGDEIAVRTYLLTRVFQNASDDHSTPL